MTGRWSNPSAFRADPAAAPALRPSRRQALALLTVLVLAAGAIAVASYLVRPEKARAFDLFHGSLFLADQKAPVAVDLASGKPTLRLLGADKQVGITGSQQLDVVPLTDRTLLLNRATGEFNMVDNGGFVVKHDGGGVPLAKRAGNPSSFGVASDDGQAYIVRTGATGGTDVYLVNQTTVESAINATKSVRPRASTSMAQTGSVLPGGAAAADGDLWLLVGGTGTAGQHTIRRLSLPAGSSPGARLNRSDHGSVDGAAALGSATTGTEGAGPTVVGVASADRIRLFAPNTNARTERFAAAAGVDSILPTSNGQGRLAFLLHGNDGWSITSVNADGSGLRAPKRLDGIAADARLTEPAASNGSVYTIDTSGQIYRIGYDGKVTDGAAPLRYPLVKIDGHVVESANLSDAYAVARGSRVVFNSASHAKAMVLFTDGSRGPLSIEKSSAVSVNASVGAEALTKTIGNPDQSPGKNPPGSKPKPKPQGAQQVNTKVDCRTATQKPHVPVITSAVPGSRTVALNWSYTLLDNQDCFPSTFLVTATLISGDAPSAPSSVRVQSQTGTNLSGLFPSTTYEITVTAFINGQGTPSGSVRITTGKEGPAAPTGLAVHADNAGDWIVDWNSCGGVAQGCVPAQSWTVTPSFCDGRGVAAPPTPLTETADPTSRKQPSATYKGGGDLLGRGLQFQVQGTGDSGQAGTPSAKSGCVTSWSPPDVTGVTLSASRPDDVALGATTSTTVSLDLGGQPVQAVGGVGATIVLRLSGPDGSSTKSVTYTGRSTDLTATFGGIRAGAQYQASATITPPGHAGSAVPVPPQPVIAAAAWPSALGIHADCPPALLFSCDLSVSFTGLSSAQANGEHFSLADSYVECGNTTQTLSLDGFDPGNAQVQTQLSQLNGFYGECTVRVTLAEDGTAPLLFGGHRSPELTTVVSLGQAKVSGAGAGDFSVAWRDRGDSGSYVGVQYNGSLSADELNQLTDNWSETVTAPGGTSCGSSSATPGPQSAPAYISVDATCVSQHGGSSDAWTITVSYQNAVDGSAVGPFAFGLPGPPPNYQPCAPSGFAAQWGATRADGVAVTSIGSQLASCSDWQYTLQDGAGAVCTAASGAPSSAPPTTVPLACASPTGKAWHVIVQWRDPAGGTQSQIVAVGGIPPKS